MAERIPCEFMLVRYVHNVISGEFLNIGVILMASRLASANPQILFRFTEDWSRVLCMDPDADLTGFGMLEDHLVSRFRLEHDMAANEVKYVPVLAQLLETLSNSLQISNPQACLAEDVNTELNLLMQLYVGRTNLAKDSKRSSREAILSEMRRQFRQEDVWHLLKKSIGAALYTRLGDPMRIDCGYRHGGVIRLFQAVTLGSNTDSAMSLAYSFRLMVAGIERVEGAAAQMTAVVEPLRRIAIVDGEQEAGERYRFCVEAMEREGIRVLTTNELAEPARTARVELVS